MQLLPVHDESRVSEARRKASAFAERLGFDATDAGRVAIAATELATNLVKHARGGDILCGPFADETGDGLELIALDKGRGMADIGRCLEDGYSTAGSAGEGLGAVRRQSNAFEVASWPGLGTAVLARFVRGRQKLARPVFAGIAMPIAGEDVCGDAWSARTDGAVCDLMLADGLGHGAGAAGASNEAVRVFKAAGASTPLEFVDRAHDALKTTRGAAVAAVRLHPSSGSAVFCGLGNIAGVVVSGGEARRMVSHNGTAGLARHRIQAFSYDLKPAYCVVLHSDGVSNNWSLDRYPGLAAAHPALVAAILWRDHARGRDDATVVVATGGWS
ncbi:anti-sigma regulatory factor [Chthonobacter albigriseus]|uniref:anti-sigma regulatory factor n=1 Tax=Chthonobacter albigriseus TaxID=1683161 RepID=UPI0015EEF959|nr:anti-sigma regulatory factor [Chthonobacter albigriseus]